MMIATLLYLRGTVRQLHRRHKDLGETVVVECDEPDWICCARQKMNWTVERQQFQNVAQACSGKCLEVGFDSVVARKRLARLKRSQPKKILSLDARLQGTLRSWARSVEAFA